MFNQKKVAILTEQRDSYRVEIDILINLIRRFIDVSDIELNPFNLSCIFKNYYKDAFEKHIQTLEAEKKEKREFAELCEKVLKVIKDEKSPEFKNETNFSDGLANWVPQVENDGKEKP